VWDVGRIALRQPRQRQLVLTWQTATETRQHSAENRGRPPHLELVFR
jgi:hypothetical protein